VATETVLSVVPVELFNVKSTCSGPPLGAPALATTAAVAPPMTPPAAGVISEMVPSVTASHLNVMSLQTSLALHTGQDWTVHTALMQASFDLQISLHPPAITHSFCDASQVVPEGQLALVVQTYLGSLQAAASAAAINSAVVRMVLPGVCARIDA